MTTLSTDTPAEAAAREQLKRNLRSREWRLSHLYWIEDKDGNTVRFKPNHTQRRFLAKLHNRNLVLKSRQHGMTTLGALLALDTALFRSNTACGIVLHQKEVAEQVFRNKVLFAYDRLPEWLKAAVPLRRRDMNGEIELGNGSRLSVSLSHRGGTLQFLWISEYGPMCAFTPLRANEVKTGALNTLAPGMFVTIESTAHGRHGDYYAMATRAMKLLRLVLAGVAKLTLMDYAFHFFPWHEDPTNQLDPDGVPIPPELEDYFEKLAAGDPEQEVPPIELSEPQRAWYAKKSEEQGDAMKREHPSTPHEAFEAIIEGAYYGKELVRAEREGRVCNLPVIPGVPVNTFWDIGYNDTTAIWFHQQVGPWHHFIDYYENSGEQAAHYAHELVKRGYRYGKHYLPHDGVNTEWAGQGNLTRLQVLENLGVKPTVLVPRIEHIGDGIDMVRQVFSRCRFDRTRCGETKPGEGRGGLPALASYQKKWNETSSTWHDYPLHNWASNGADAFRQFAQGFPLNGVNDATTNSRRRDRRGGWKTA
ncbi:MAG TPA: DNA packaging protein [Rhodanobacteraceae bacterium]|nr:DNA packaging protein [Rhodanobacteraceae bacterium]